MIQSDRVQPVDAAQRPMYARLTFALVLYMRLCGLTALGLVCVFWPQPILLTMLLAVVAALMLSVRRRLEDVVLLVLCGAFGAFAESFGIAGGAWSYTLPLVNGVPLLLPFIWGIAALFVKEISLQIHFVLSQPIATPSARTEHMAVEAEAQTA